MRDGFSRFLLEDEEIGNTDILEPIPDDEGEVEQEPAGNTAAVTTVDISTFGSDNSDVHNEYDPKEIERLNILIASENSAIGEYFTAAKETNIDVLRRLYSDIGEEERFHSEQLIFAKSQITGETYVPRDPDVKAEYEKLLDMGMDEETAMTTAVDKVGLMNRERTVTPEEEAQQREDLIEDMEVVEYSMYQEYLIFNMMTSPRIKDLYEHDSAIRNYCESYIDTAVELTPQVFVEAVVDSSSLPANKQKVLPDLLGSIIRLIRDAIKAIKTMGQKFTQFWVNMRETRKHYASWLKNHSIKDIFAKGFSLYLWDDNKNDFDFDDPAAFIYLLNSATEKVANEFGISVKKPTPKFNMATNKTINASSIDEAIQIVKNAKFIPTKIVLNENNEQTILTKIFGITNAKLNNERDSADKSMNGYNSFEALVSDCNAYLENANAVLTQLNQLKGQQGGTVQSDPEKFNTAIKQMKDIANGYTKWINIINHDMTAMMKINNDLAAQIKAGTEEEDINSSVEKLQKNKEALQRELTRLEGEKAKNPNNSTVLKAITETKNKIAKIDAQLNRATREPQTPPAKQPQDQGAPAETPEGQGTPAVQTNNNKTTPEVSATNASQIPIEQNPSNQKQTDQPLTEQLKSIGVTRQINEEDGKKLVKLTHDAQSSGKYDDLLNWYIQILKSHYSK